MRHILFQLTSTIRSSYWFIPLVMAVFACMLAIGVTTIDRYLGQDWIHKGGFVLINQPEGARAILATIAGSMITVTGVTFSMTIVAVSFALGQVGPRLIHNFMRDKANQFTLGTFIATFLYCLLVLRTVLSANETNLRSAFVPHIAVFLSIVLVLINVVMLIYFIHHIQENLNISALLSRIGNDLLKQIKNLYPSTIGQPNSIEPDPEIEFKEIITSQQNGYIRHIAGEDLLNTAHDLDAVIKLTCQPGIFVTYNTPVVEINRHLSDENKSKILDCIIIGNERDQEQDLLFLSDELVEIIARALSPGVNDPFTAITALNWMQSAIELFLERSQPNMKRYDENKQLRIIAETFTCADFINRIFLQVQPYVSQDLNVSIHLLQIINNLILNSKNKTFKALFIKHAINLNHSFNDGQHSQQEKELLNSFSQDIKKLHNS